MPTPMVKKMQQCHSAQKHRVTAKHPELSAQERHPELAEITPPLARSVLRYTSDKTRDKTGYKGTLQRQIVPPFGRTAEQVS